MHARPEAGTDRRVERGGRGPTRPVDRVKFCSQDPRMNGPPPRFRSEATTPGVDAHGPLLQSIRAGKIVFHAPGRGHYPGARLGARELPGRWTCGYWDACGGQDWGTEIHRNEGIEMCLRETGAMNFAVDRKKHPLGPGDLTITRPRQAHRQGDPFIAAGRMQGATIAVRAERARPDVAGAALGGARPGGSRGTGAAAALD